MADRLTIYNGALGLLGERKIASLSENRGPRRKLDTAWDADFVDHMLDQGYWNFALRTVRMTASPDVTPDFGYRYAFDRPADWIKTANISLDEYFSCPLDRYLDEGSYLWCDYDTIYLQYVSNDETRGGDLSKWSPAFAKYAEAELAYLTADSITGSSTKEAAMMKLAKQRRGMARSSDAMNQPRQESPHGSWVNARHNGGRRRYDRPRGQLIG